MINHSATPSDQPSTPKPPVRGGEWGGEWEYEGKNGCERDEVYVSESKGKRVRGECERECV